MVLGRLEIQIPILFYLCSGTLLAGEAKPIPCDQVPGEADRPGIISGPETGLGFQFAAPQQITGHLLVPGLSP